MWDDLVQHVRLERSGKGAESQFHQSKIVRKMVPAWNVYKSRLHLGTRHQSALGYNGDRSVANADVQTNRGN